MTTSVIPNANPDLVLLEVEEDEVLELAIVAWRIWIDLDDIDELIPPPLPITVEGEHRIAGRAYALHDRGNDRYWSSHGRRWRRGKEELVQYLRAQKASPPETEAS